MLRSPPPSSAAAVGPPLFLGQVGSQPVPRCFAGNIDVLDTHVADTRAEDGDDHCVLGTDVEGGVHDFGRHKNAIPWTQSSLLLLDPVLDCAGDHIDVFLLLGVVVEAVSLAGEEGSLDHGEVLGPGRGRIAQPAEPRNVQLISLDVILEYELAGHSHLRCPLSRACAQARNSHSLIYGTKPQGLRASIPAGSVGPAPRAR